MLTHFGEINPFVVDENGDTFLHIYFARPNITKDTFFFTRMLHGELPNLPKQHVQKLLNTQNKFLESPLLIFIKEKRGVRNLPQDAMEFSPVNFENSCQFQTYFFHSETFPKKFNHFFLSRMIFVF
jgi:hypothetical protein